MILAYSYQLIVDLAPSACYWQVAALSQSDQNDTLSESGSNHITIAIAVRITGAIKERSQFIRTIFSGNGDNQSAKPF